MFISVIVLAILGALAARSACCCLLLEGSTAQAVRFSIPMPLCDTEKLRSSAEGLVDPKLYIISSVSQRRSPS
ncbi:hypothetical protein QBC46DRAFT_23378 [Diplogelasinospora grovesii]|uniref:Secreted protein n=1 Tax=Diplogelasinospora grovesii TaxID=303347 RepID=A0AAN6S1B7_9PEZI|nr:hypothetical protein QBC46DRAFT_23378 [Diplogelasinospora grovesii]